ncbi:MAG: hypothetical protein ACJAS1_003273 [Oleiphilaceae bacterium]|jgi:hypothetical protein
MITSLISLVIAYYIIKSFFKGMQSVFRAVKPKAHSGTRYRGAAYVKNKNGHRVQAMPVNTVPKKAVAVKSWVEEKPTAKKQTVPANGYAFLQNKSSNKGQTVVPINARFNWSQLPMLAFESWDAEPLHCSSEFSSIQHLGDAKVKATQWERPQDGYLPHVQQDLTSISIDDQTFDKDQVYVKPDAVFFDPKSNEFFVVEYKNRQFRGLHSLFPENVFQLLTSAAVIQQILLSGAYGLPGDKAPKVRCFMRLENKVTEVVGWDSLSSHLLEMAADLMAAQDKRSICATEVGQHFVLFDPVFKKQTDDNEQRCIQGKLKHYRMAKQAQQIQKGRSSRG